MFILTKFILQIKLIYYGIPNNLKQFIKKTFTIVKALILVNDVDLLSNQFIQDLEVLCGLKGIMNLWSNM
jgi:hypothetical protein